jgi:hypothetical protein
MMVLVVGAKHDPSVLLKHKRMRVLHPFLPTPPTRARIVKA